MGRPEAEEGSDPHWKIGDDLVLRSLVASGEPIDSIAADLGRIVYDVARRIRELGLQ